MAQAYRDASKLVAGADQRRGSLKTLAFKDGGSEVTLGKRKVFALASETLRYRAIIDELIDCAGVRQLLFGNDCVRDKQQAYVMLYDLLFGKGSIQGGGQVKRHLAQAHEALATSLKAMRAKRGLAEGAPHEALLPSRARRFVFPRYARVNLVKASVAEVVERLRADGYDPQVDDLIPTLLVLPRGTELHEHPLTVGGQLVLQDKSSCFSAQALLEDVPESGEEGEENGEEERKTEARDKQVWPCERWAGGDVVDACAAPGNKTMHVMALLHERAVAAAAAKAATSAVAADGASICDRVIAFDKDERRLAVLRRRVDAAGGETLVVSAATDFLDVDPSDPALARVRAVLLDPSCSGSGIVTAPERSHDGASSGGTAGGGDAATSETERVEALAEFQLAALLKAFSIPQVERVVYSTCSLHAAENEDVVARALAQQPQRTGVVGLFEVVPCLVGWPRRGLGNSSGSSSDGSSGGGGRNNGSGGGDDSVCGGDNGGGTGSRGNDSGHRTGESAAVLTPQQVQCLVRADPLQGDATNGFFVAKFVRRQQRQPPAAGFVKGPASPEAAEAPQQSGVKRRRRTEHARQKKREQKKVRRKRARREGRVAANGAEAPPDSAALP
ncbi:unnamed protein product [Phaeothamnion confervicola]